MSRMRLIAARSRLPPVSGRESQGVILTMTESISVRGFAGNTPEIKNPESDNPVATFRLGATPRWRSGQTGEWTSGETNWYTVACFGRLAHNVADSLHKGDPVVVVGRPKVRTWTTDQNDSGAEIEISAQSIGHDLKFGTTQYRKVSRSEPTHVQEEPESPTGDDAAQDTTSPHRDTASATAWEGEPALDHAA